MGGNLGVGDGVWWRRQVCPPQPLHHQSTIGRAHAWLHTGWFDAPHPHPTPPHPHTHPTHTGTPPPPPTIPPTLPTPTHPYAGFTLPAALPVAAVLAAVAVPGFLVKQAVNVVQLRTAAAQLVAYDHAREAGKKGRAAL